MAARRRLPHAITLSHSNSEYMIVTSKAHTPTAAHATIRFPGPHMGGMLTQGTPILSQSLCAWTLSLSLNTLPPKPEIRFSLPRVDCSPQTCVTSPFGLYKIVFSCETVVHESTMRSFSTPTCIAHPGAILLHDYWAVYDSPSELSFVCYAPYNIGYTNIV